MVPARHRLGAVAGLQHALPVLLFYWTLVAVMLWALPQRAWELKAGFLITLGFLNSWRYSWAATSAVRSFIYRRFTFPKIRRAANALPEEKKYPDHLYLIIPTYHERPWVSRRMMRSVLRATCMLPCATTIVVSTGSAEEDDIFIDMLKGHPFSDRVELILMRQSGKRSAMAMGLRAIARRSVGESSITVLMDGDTVLAADIFEKTLPLFALNPRLGGVTTDNLCQTEGAPWYGNWYDLRFAMRHRFMCATSLSGRVLTLTGRFSMVRTETATSEDFLRYVEQDELDHWIYGRIKFLTGDDKSTWFYLLKEGWEMWYVPDTMIYCMETSGEEPFRQSWSKMARWFGNMLRNNWRSIKLGPKRMGFYTWWCLLDQRASIWTALVGPTTAILLALCVSPYFLLFYLAIAISIRSIDLVVLAIQGHRVNLRDIPLLFFTQWGGALVKIKVLANISRQSWGARTGDKGRKKIPFVPRFMETFQYCVWMALFVMILAAFVLNSHR